MAQADVWPPASKAASYYLVSPKSEEIHGSLSAEAPKEKKASVTFLSDPEKPVVNSYNSRARTITGI